MQYKITTCRTCNLRPNLKWSPHCHSCKYIGVHKNRLKLVFDLDYEVYNQMLADQNGVCAICGLKDTQRLAVDHDHKTGKIRALLCKGCNMGLGLLKDDPDLLRRGSEYLKYHAS